MLKKFAVLAVMAAFVVACGPSQEDLDALKHMQDSIENAMKADSMRMADEAAAVEAAAAAAAQAAADSVAAAAAAPAQ